MQKIFFSVLFSCPLLFVGCFKNQANKFNTVIESLKRDTFYTDIPKTTRGDNSSEYLGARRLEIFYNLESIESGYDSINIRIWLGYKMDLTGYLNITNNNNKWQAVINLYSFYKSNPEDTFSVKKQSDTTSPKNGWRKFVEELAGLNFLTLPNDGAISGYDLHTDESQQVIVEISTKYFYRIYAYTEPLSHSSYIKEAAQLEKILAFLEEQLDFRMPEKI